MEEEVTGVVRAYILNGNDALDQYFHISQKFPRVYDSRYKTQKILCTGSQLHE